jgi:hypothetical protein
MSETHYYIRNWGKICFWLALYCLAELIFDSLATIPKTILFGILLTNNRKFLYLIKDRDEIFKKYFQFLKASCILIGIGAFLMIIEGVLLSLPNIYYVMYYGGSDWYHWVYENYQIVEFWSLVINYSIVISGVILETIAWIKLKEIFKWNLIKAQPYQHDNLVRGTNLLIWGAILLSIFYLANVGYRVWFLFYGKIYNPYLYYGYPLSFFTGISYTLLYWIIRICSSVALILLGIGYATIGSNLKNPYFSGGTGVVYRQPPRNPRFGIKFDPGLEPQKTKKTDYSKNYCPHCGENLRPNAIYCPKCGQRIS